MNDYQNYIHVYCDTCLYEITGGAYLLVVLLLYISSDIIVICRTVPTVLKYMLYYITPTRIFRLA